ncbi:hypothetical protein F5Y16DRAFT_378234 [Xylariaceae sp. FL0255]|nr:hypothetical protein F5Y16DRAFT_378234 [Xylariaceae sp. FL0255]
MAGNNGNMDVAARAGDIQGTEFAASQPAKKKKYYVTLSDPYYRAFRTALLNGEIPTPKLYLGALISLKNHSESDFPPNLVRKHWNPFVENNAEYAQILRQEAADSCFEDSGHKLGYFNMDMDFEMKKNRISSFIMIAKGKEIETWAKGHGIDVPDTKKRKALLEETRNHREARKAPEDRPDGDEDGVDDSEDDSEGEDYRPDDNEDDDDRLDDNQYKDDAAAAKEKGMGKKRATPTGFSANRRPAKYLKRMFDKSIYNFTTGTHVVIVSDGPVEDALPSPTSPTTSPPRLLPRTVPRLRPAPLPLVPASPTPPGPTPSLDPPSPLANQAEQPPHNDLGTKNLSDFRSQIFSPSSLISGENIEREIEAALEEYLEQEKGGWEEDAFQSKWSGPGLFQ